LRSWNNRVESNHLYNSEKYGIELEKTTENIISNNYIEFIGHYGVYLNDTSPTET
jgi:parallel beta-helix repeat protein